jgi:hypothetical protein
MNASIPFEFRVGDRVMAPGTYQINNLRSATATSLFQLSNVKSGGSMVLLALAPVDPRKEWIAGQGKLRFTCIGGSCVLSELWSGSESQGYAFHGPKLGQGEIAVLREIPMQPGKGE